MDLSQHLALRKAIYVLGIVVHAFNPHIQEAEAEANLWGVPGQPAIQKKTSWKKEKAIYNSLVLLKNTSILTRVRKFTLTSSPLSVLTFNRGLLPWPAFSQCFKWVLFEHSVRVQADFISWGLLNAEQAQHLSVSCCLWWWTNKDLEEGCSYNPDLWGPWIYFMGFRWGSGEG